MANVQNDNFLLKGKKHLDARRLRLDGTPWTSVLEVNNAFIDNDRVESQVYFIVDKEYWYLGGTENENLVEKLGGGTGELISKFTSNPTYTIDEAVIFIPANETWLINSVLYTNSIINEIPFNYASAGASYFLTIVATKFNTFIARVGGQSFSNPDEPIIDLDEELPLTTFLVYDNEITVIIPPVNSNIYVEKESFLPLNFFSSGVVGSEELDKRNNIIFNGAITKLGNIIKNNPNHFVVGLPFMTTNRTSNAIEIEHMNTTGGSGVIPFFNTEETSYFLQPNEVAIWISEILNGQKIHRRVSSYIDRDSVIFRSGTEVGKDIFGDLKFGDGISLVTEELDGIQSLLKSKNGKWQIEIIDGITSSVTIFDPDKGIFSDKLFDLDNDENAYIQKGHIVQLEEDVFNLKLNKANQDTTYTKTEVDNLDTAIVNLLRNGVTSEGDTLNKLYNLILGASGQVTKANIAERNAYNVPLGGQVFVLDDGDGKWALYKATTSGVGATYVKLSDPDLLNAVMTGAMIKIAYSAEPNAFNDALKITYDNAVSAINSVVTQLSTYLVDNLYSNATDKALTANQGKVLDSKITVLNNAISTINTALANIYNKTEVNNLVKGLTRSNIRQVNGSYTLEDQYSGKDTFIKGNSRTINLPSDFTGVLDGYVETFIMLGTGGSLTNSDALPVIGLPTGVTFPIALAQFSSVRITRTNFDGVLAFYIDGDII